MSLSIYNGSPPLLFFDMSYILQLRKHFHEYQLFNKHENEKCGNYHTHTQVYLENSSFGT